MAAGRVGGRGTPPFWYGFIIKGEGGRVGDESLKGHSR